jgi:subtilisin family serine protease
MHHIGIKLSCILALALLSACGQDARPTAVPTAGDAIAGQYIVALHKPELEVQGGATLEPTRVAASLGVQNLGSLKVIGGFVAVGVDKAALARLRADPRVRYAEQDRVVTLSGAQSRPTWGLDRIDERSLPLDTTYRYRADGGGVTAYVIDTGIRKGHPEFGGRLIGGVSAIDDGRGYTDCNGHGTHVAGTLGGKTYGVAKDVLLMAVRVFGCSGSSSNSTIISGVDWVAYNHKTPAVANMSFESRGSRALDEAVKALVAEGVTVTVAAGNGSGNACDVSPARVPGVLTVGASNRRDRLWEGTNYGGCVDLFAPGEDVTSAGLGSSSLTMTGTSMASPHVAGVTALILEQSRNASPSTVISRIKARATSGKLKSSSSSSGSPNRLLYSNF